MPTTKQSISGRRFVTCENTADWGRGGAFVSVGFLIYAHEGSVNYEIERDEEENACADRGA